MHFGRDLGVLQGQKVDGGVFDMHRIIFGLQNKRWRRLSSHVNLRIGRKVLLGESEVAGIDDHGEVRPATDLIGGIDRIIETLLKVRAESGGKVGSSREAKHADAMRIDLPLGRTGAHDAEGTLGVLQRRGGLGVRPRVGHAILQQEASDPNGVQPIAYFRAFEVNSENVVGAAGKNNDGSAGVPALGRVNRQGRVRYIAQTNYRLASDQFVFGGSGIDLRAGVRLGARRSVRPNGESRMAGSRLPRGLLSEQGNRACNNYGKKKRTLAHGGSPSTRRRRSISSGSSLDLRRALPLR